MKNIKDLFIKAGAVLAALGLVLVSSPVAHAQYTGTNGRIIDYFLGGGAVSVKPDGSNYYGHNISFVNTGFLYRQFVYSPDGTKIAYTIKINDTTANLAIKPANLITTGTALTSDTSVIDGNPYFSPDGTKIAFARRDQGTGITDIYVVNADGTSLTRLTQNLFTSGGSSAQSAYYPTWKSDGSLIYVSTTSTTGGTGIYSISPSSANQTTATAVVTGADLDGESSGGMIFDISPDNTKFIYQSLSGDAGSLSSIRSVNVDGTGDTAVKTSNASYTYTIGSYSPDGTKIVYARTHTADPNTYYDLVVANADGTSETVIYPYDTNSLSANPTSAAFWGTNQDTYPDNGSLGGFDTPTVPNTASSFIAKAKSNPLAIAVSTLAVLGLIALGGYWVRTELKKKR
jgi:Tol biopolymer transport system component